MAKEGSTDNKALYGVISGDKVLWIILSVMFIISILVVYSSTAKMAYDINNPTGTRGFLLAQLFWLVISIISAYLVSLIKSRVFYNIAPYIFWGGVALTFITLIIGQATNGAARWLTIPGIGIGFQPSEVLKVGVVMYLARILSLKQDVISKMRIVPTLAFWRWGLPEEKAVLKGGFRSILLPIIIAGAVILPAHTSSALIVGFISFMMLMIGRVKWSELGRICIIAAAAIVIYSSVGFGRSDTATSRVDTWIETLTSNRRDVPVDKLTDTERSMIAINGGGLIGHGAGQSAMRVEIMHPESDYAYAFFIEEYGLIMGLVLLLFYLWIFFRSINIYRSGCPPFSGFLILGVALLITSQALLHIMVTINLAPETGQPLPIISRGGTSLLITSLAIGMILSVSRQREEIKSMNITD
ncbi:MAG: FtsW/RodA/SpoVE family cell cycle protein [Rikenellaceae bacterium]